MVTRKLTSRASRAFSGVAVLAVMALGAIPAMAVEAPQSGEGETVVGEAELPATDDGGGATSDDVSEEGVRDAVAGLFAAPSVVGSQSGDAVESPASRAINPSYSGVFSNWKTTGINYYNDGAPGSDAPAGAADGGKLLKNYSGRVVVRVDLKVPESSAPGDKIALQVNADDYRFVTFSNEEIDADGVDLGTMSATSSTLTITLGDAAATHTGVTAHLEFTLNPVAQLNVNRYNLPVDFTTPDGTVIKTGASYNVRKSAPNSTGMLTQAGTTVIDGVNELYVTFQPQYRDVRAENAGQPLDPASIKFTVTPKTKGMTPLYCGAGTTSFAWIDSDGFAFSSGLKADVKCNKDGSVVLTLPAGVAVPKTDNDGAPVLVRGVRINANYIVDRPEYDYTATATIFGNAKGAPLQDGKQDSEAAANNGLFTRTVRSTKLAGEGAGQLRPVKTIITKTAPEGSMPLVGDELTYTVKTVNSEELRTAYGVVTADALPKGTEFVSATGGGKHTGGMVTWPETDIEPGGEISYKVTVKVTKDAGETIKNVVTNTGENTCYAGDTTGSVCEDSVTTPVGYPAAALTKSSTVEDTNKNGVLGDPGDTILYKFTVKNTGNTAITSAKLTDDLLKLKDYECLAGPLAAGKSTTCVEATAGDFSHVITEAEGEAGKVVNHATITIPGGPGGPGTTTTPTVKPGLEFEKVVLEVQDTSGTGLGSVETGGVEGDTIVYGFEMTNTGNSTLESIVLTDELLGIEDHQCLAEGMTLEPGDTGMCVGSFSYVVTAEDAEAGEVVNTATLETPGVPEVPGEVVTPTWTPGFEFDKKVIEVKDSKGTVIKDGKALEGSTIHYGFTFTNTGDIDLKDLTVTDPMLGVEDVDCLAEGEVLPVGESVDCVDNAAYSYKVTAADVTAGKVHNLATGNVPGLPGGEGETTTPVLPTPVVTELPKTGAGGTWLIVGAGSLMLLGGAYAIVRNRRKVGDSHEMAA